MRFILTAVIFTLYSSFIFADGLVVDKVYQPYVLPFEQEFEWRLMSSQTDDKNRLGQRVGYGQSISEHVIVEGYFIGERDNNSDFGLQAYEIEIRWMATEQGQYWADWGMLFEVEKEHQQNNWEISSGILFEKEFARTSLTMNLFAIYEWGENVTSEFEVEFRAKYRYRWFAEFQPAIELYSGENFLGIGPAFMGIYRIAGQKQLKWEAGFISEVKHSGKDHTLRIALEYEF